MKYKFNKNHTLLLILMSTVANAQQTPILFTVVFTGLLFIFLGFVSWTFYKIACHYTKNMSNIRHKLIYRTLPFSLISTPVVFVDSGQLDVTPSIFAIIALGYQSSLDLLIYSFISIMLATVLIYLSLVRQDKRS